VIIVLIYFYGHYLYEVTGCLVVDSVRLKVEKEQKLFQGSAYLSMMPLV
jgi:hypothetical protein